MAIATTDHPVCVRVQVRLISRSYPKSLLVLTMFEKCARLCAFTTLAYQFWKVSKVENIRFGFDCRVSNRPFRKIHLHSNHHIWLKEFRVISLSSELFRTHLDYFNELNWLLWTKWYPFWSTLNQGRFFWS